MSLLKLLFIGDIAGKVGLITVKRQLPRLVANREIDFVVANGENIAGGVGITRELAQELFSSGVHVVTTGNHVWRQRELKDHIDAEPRLLRPLNFTSGQPGAGYGLFRTVASVPVGVVNLIGQVFMDPADNPFVSVDEALKNLSESKIIIVDMHAEATSEKRAMGFHLDGRVTAVLGTHTHVQTADDQILEGGTAYITDVGMTGPHNSVIGMRTEQVLERFRTGMPQSFKPAKGGARFQAVEIIADPSTGCAVEIERIDILAP